MVGVWGTPQKDTSRAGGWVNSLESLFSIVQVAAGMKRYHYH